MTSLSEDLKSQGLDSESLLTEVNKAIQSILVGGQSYRIGNRQLNRASLGELRAFRTQLMEEIAAEANRGVIAGASVARFGAPRG